MEANPILVEVFKHRFSSIAEEMGVTLLRTAFSPNIKERRDFSCALFDRHGDLVAQAAHIPVHLGSMPLSVKAAMTGRNWHPGDMVMLNDPFRGGTHLPDITLVAPVFADGPPPAFYVANRAHHADVGGMTPGSIPLATGIFQEGIIIPPVKIVDRGNVDRRLMRLLLANVRTPREREGDFAAQIMANTTGVKRTGELISRHSLEVVSRYARILMDYAEQLTRRAINEIPDGAYSFEDYMDDDGHGSGPVRIHVTATIRGDRAVFDFTGSDDQVQGGINAVHAVTLSSVLYVLRSLVEADIPTNAGCLRPVEVLTRPGTVVDACFPAAVAAGNVETSQRIVDVVLGALADALPHKIPAASQGTMNNLTMGGLHPATGEPFAYYETMAGGMGAGPQSDGESAVHSHMTNTLNTPVEALEYAYPLLVTGYGVRRGSGGAGRRRGGDGVVRELRLLADAEVTVLSDRRSGAPYGLMGGSAGAAGKNIVVHQGRREEQPGKFSRRLHEGDLIRIETPGGGGHGREET